MAHYSKYNMRNWINIIESLLMEAEIPATGYGYWISPEGVYHPVGYQNHAGVGRALGICPKRQNFAHAYSLGWIRVGSRIKEAPGAFYAEFKSNKVTIRATSALNRLARSEDFNNFTLTVFTENGPVNRQMHRATEFILSVNELRKSRQST